MEIITTPDPRLRQKSTKANPDDPEIKQAIEAMRKDCLDWEKEHQYELSAAMPSTSSSVSVDRKSVV